MKVVLALLLPVLRGLFSALTPTFRKVVEESLRNLYGRALGTPSGWDDFLVGVLCGIAGVSTDGVVPIEPSPNAITMPAPAAAVLMGATLEAPVVTVGGGFNPPPVDLGS